ncbi:MAG: carboxynorspermidine decarboxylase, partial [Bacteroidales bacterium]|nr:carboxynorspermidine decarboxylase [Bacteroidales bacterium]
MKNAVLPEGLPSPAYILDETLLKRNLEKIRAVGEASGAEFILALKGFAMWSAFPIFNAAGFSKATASSPWEARLEMEEMGAPAHTYAPAYTNEEMEEVASMSSHITFNSLAQFHRFADKAREINSTVSLGLRVNPELSLVETDLYNPCGENSRLGVRRSELPDPSAWPAALDGMHCHALCESSAAESALLVRRFEEKFGDYLPHLRWVNFGGGHLVTRAGYETDVLVGALRDFKARHPHLHVILEPGSAFAWETGYLLCTVLD